MVKALVNEDISIMLPQHRADRPEWYTEKGWEKERLKSLHDELIKGRVQGYQEIMFYIGAEEGEMAAMCQMWGAKVVLFEPNPKAWSHIRAIWQANELEKPLGIYTGFASDINQLAQSPLPPVGLLDIADDGWPNCSDQEMEAAHGFKELDKEGNTFNQITIDTYVNGTGIIPTAISLDVEGSEGRVLRGAEKTLREHHPKIWLSGHPEFLHDNFNGGGGFDYLRELRDWLKKDIGYEEELLAYDHEVHLMYKFP